MKKPKLLIIVLFQNLGEGRPYYASSPAPPLPGILLAGMTPDTVDVEVLHEMVRPIDYQTDAKFIALSFMDYCAPHAFEVARKFQALGKTVIAGGKYASTFPEEVISHFDSTVVGEAHTVWPQVVEDMLAGKLARVYKAPFAAPLENIPPPRYDLVEPEYAVPVVIEATRGCPYKCSFCQLTVKNEGYRKRPISDVIRDLKATTRLPVHKRKIAMLYDNNLGGDMDYAKELLREIAKLDLWGLGVQFSFDCLRDDEFVDLLAQAHCKMAFIGLESLNEPSLARVHKMHNRVKEYQELFLRLKKRGILTFTGLILALDGDTPQYYEALPERLREVDPSTILLSLAIPIPGTPFHARVEADGRIADKNLAHYDGDHLVLKPAQVEESDIRRAFINVNRTFYSWRAIASRWWRFLRARGFKAPIGRWIFDTLILAGMYFKLSLFQKGHAMQRVYNQSGPID